MRHTPRWLAAFVIVSFLAAAAYGAGFIMAWKADRAEMAMVSQEELEQQFQVFWEVWDLLDRRFIDRSKIDRQQMVYGATRGMVESLGDPHTIFAEPRRNAALRQDLEGTYEGIGVSVAKNEGQLVVVSPLEDSPGARAGLRAGDVILRVDGADISMLSVYEAVARIRGPRGSTIRLTVVRPGEASLLQIDVVRAAIKVDSVRTATLRGGIVYMKVTAFRQGTADQVAATLKTLQANPPPGLILDLRDNPGGYLNTGVAVTSQFLASGVVLHEEEAGGDQRTFAVKKGGLALEVPLVVLVNKGSASASEIVAGALQDYGRATLIGQQTYGKGSVQSVRELSDGSGLRVTVARWLTPKKRHIQGEGLAPDIEIEPAADGSVDRPLERAIVRLLSTDARLAP